ncbi:SRPBCC family protein [Haloarculaceae archaeon H-GB2-1]|nr:SRPBCC family protein [Haloarculaceae archaeon H-GB11]MEA5407884.1 SRPBCC family protein [Haloarculaceae archaeon H-GB2-1]
MDLSLERTPEGRRLCVAERVACPATAAWSLLTDTERWPEWGPSVRAVEATDRYVRAGTTGRVRTVGGLWLPFEVTSCRAYRWGWRVAGCPRRATE